MASPTGAAQPASAAPAAEGGDGEAARGPEDLDLASLLASFPPDVREDVLLNSGSELLATLPPALLAEAQELRQRHARVSVDAQ